MLPPVQAQSLDSPRRESRTSRLILTLAARDLKDTDINSVSDPFCVVATVVSHGRSKQYKEVGRTEVINNCLDPEWCTKLQMKYLHEEEQRMKFEIYDKGPPGKDKLLGTATMFLHDIVRAKLNRITVPLFAEGKHHGFVTVTAEPVREGRQESVYFVLSATKLDKKDFLGKCDPFLKISRINYDNTLQLAFRTRYREQNLNPKWKPFEIQIDQLCYGDKNREFLIECYDWDQDGNHDLVGATTTTVNRLVSQQDTRLSLINEKKSRKSKKYIDSGVLHFQKVYCWFDFTFQDFLSAGTELDFMVAVAFPQAWEDDTASVHSQADQFEMAIRTTVDICQSYNASQSFQAYGFGARLPHLDRSQTTFALNMESGLATCEGVPALMHAYLKAKRTVQLGAPANFAPIIRMAAQRAARAPADGSQYAVLLLITDGCISDLDRTKQEVVKASCLPLSIVVVGVGYDTFEEMKELDSDNHMLSWNGKTARRDIVQFVQLRSFLPPHKRLNEEEEMEAKRELAKEVFQEIPLQLTSYMKSKGISPRQPPNDARSHVPLRNALSDNVTRTRRLLPQVPTADMQQQLRI